MIVGMTSGCWDLLHASHLYYLDRCKEQCDRLIVGVDSDQLVKDNKGPHRPIHSEIHRLDLVWRLDKVDCAFIARSMHDYDEAAKLFNVLHIFKSERFRHFTREEIHGCLYTDADLVIIPDVDGMVSTTHIVNRIREGKPI